MMDENTIGTKLLEAAIEVHRELGYLLNFGGEVMQTGITRCVNGLPE